MRMQRLAPAILALALWHPGCGRSGLAVPDPAPGADASIDAAIARRDAEPPDAAAPPDAEPPRDAGSDAPIGPCGGGCDDAIACTVDRCAAACEHEPSDALCPPQHTCDRDAGCVTRAIVSEVGAIFRIVLPTGAVEELGSVPRALADLATSPDGSAFAATDDRVSLLTLDPAPVLRDLAPLTAPIAALDVDREGRLLGAGGGRIALFDPRTGAETRLAVLPAEVSAIGDLARLECASGERWMATATLRDERSVLLELDESGVAQIVGELGLPCVDGLVAAGPALYGVTCTGWVVSIDPDTGAVTRHARHPLKFLGAALEQAPVSALVVGPDRTHRP